MYEQIRPLAFSCSIELHRYDIVKENSELHANESSSSSSSNGSSSSASRSISSSSGVSKSTILKSLAKLPILPAEISGSQYVQYTLDVIPNNSHSTPNNYSRYSAENTSSAWQIKVRFRELFQLSETLKARWPHIVLPSFPPKSTLTTLKKFDSAFLQSRAFQITEWLNKLTEHESLMSAPEVLQFLELKKNLPYTEISKFTNNLPRLKTQVAVAGSKRLNKNLVDFVFSPKNSLLIVASSDKENLENFVKGSLSSAKDNLASWISGGSANAVSSSHGSNGCGSTDNPAGSFSTGIDNSGSFSTAVSSSSSSGLSANSSSSGLGANSSSLSLWVKRSDSIEFDNVWICEFGACITCIAADINSYTFTEEERARVLNQYGSYPTDVYGARTDKSCGAGTDTEHSQTSLTRNNGAHVFCGLSNGQIGWRRLNDIDKNANPDWREFLLPGILSSGAASGDGTSTSATSSRDGMTSSRETDTFSGSSTGSILTSPNQRPKTALSMFSSLAEKAVVSVAGKTASTTSSWVQKTTSATSAKQVSNLYSSSKAISALAYDSQYALLFYATRDGRVVMYSLSCLKVVSEIKLTEGPKEKLTVGTHAVKMELDREHNRLVVVTSAGGLLLLEFCLQRVGSPNGAASNRARSSVVPNKSMPNIFRLHGYIGAGEEQTVWCRGVLQKSFKALDTSGLHVNDFVVLPEEIRVTTDGHCRMEGVDGVGPGYHHGSHPSRAVQMSYSPGQASSPGLNSSNDDDLDSWDNENHSASWQNAQASKYNKRGRGRRAELGATIPSSTQLLLACKEGLSFYRMECNTKESTGTLAVPALGKKLGVGFFGRKHPRTVCFAVNSAEIIAGYSDGSIGVYDIFSTSATSHTTANTKRGQNCCFTAVEGQKAVNKVIFLNEERRMLSAGRDGLLKFWEFPSMGGSLDNFLGGATVENCVPDAEKGAGFVHEHSYDSTTYDSRSCAEFRDKHEGGYAQNSNYGIDTDHGRNHYYDSQMQNDSVRHFDPYGDHSSNYADRVDEYEADNSGYHNHNHSNASSYSAERDPYNRYAQYNQSQYTCESAGVESQYNGESNDRYQISQTRYTEDAGSGGYSAHQSSNVSYSNYGYDTSGAQELSEGTNHGNFYGNSYGNSYGNERQVPHNPYEPSSQSQNQTQQHQYGRNRSDQIANPNRTKALAYDDDSDGDERPRFPKL